jgi:hypothetical protein
VGTKDFAEGWEHIELYSPAQQLCIQEILNLHLMPFDKIRNYIYHHQFTITQNETIAVCSARMKEYLKIPYESISDFMRIAFLRITKTKIHTEEKIKNWWLLEASPLHWLQLAIYYRIITEGIGELDLYVKRGLLYDVTHRVVCARCADKIAIANKFLFAEQLTDKYNGKKITVDKNLVIIDSEEELCE